MPPKAKDDDHGGDTIIVKGEQGVSHPSSPESLSPEIEPLVTHDLSQINPQQHLESPEPYEDTPAAFEQPDTQSNRRNLPTRKPKANVTTMEDRLQQMPEIRSLPWRPGVEEGADIETGGESRRKQIRFGCLLATRGQVQVPGCNSCANGRGKFSLCIALDGYFKGACASCQLSGRPNRCSIKKEDDVISSPVAGTPSVNASFDHGQQATPSSDSRPSGPPRKRRRMSEVKDANEAKRTSPKGAPPWNPQPPQYQHPQLAQQAPQSQPQHQSQTQPHNQPQIRSQPQTHTQPQTQSQPPPQTQSQPQPQPQTQTQTQPQPPLVNNIPQKTWAAVNQPLPRPVPSNGTNGNGHLARDQYRPATTTGWATVNQPPQPHVQPQSHLRSQLPSQLLSQSPLQPQTHPQIHTQPHTHPQAALSVQQLMQNGGDSHGNGSYRNAERERRESTIGNEEGGSGALIDTLPKSKQRQVYGLVSGLQGGIEHLQRELDSLKRALGIDDDT